MSNRIEDYTDEELVEHYRDMQHLSIDVSSSKGIGNLAFFHGLIREMARRFAELIESNEEEQMSENDIKEMITIIDTLALKELMENAKDWKISEDHEALVYILAFNDGLIRMANRLKAKLEELLPQKFEEAADEQK